MKCVCCKFDNCLKEFEKHQSGTTFSALDKQFTEIDNLCKNASQYRDRVCDLHKQTIADWLENVVQKAFEKYKKGVFLPKIRTH